MKQFKNTRSLFKGEITREEIDKILSSSKLQENLLEYHFEDPEGDDLDTLVCEGDLSVDDNLSLYDIDIRNLIVTGNLTVNGLLEHYDDPTTFIFVGGNLKVKNLITSGTLEVFGNVEAEHVLAGDGNDYFAAIYGSVTAQFFYPHDHYFQIDGSQQFEYAYGSPYRVNNKENDIQFKNDDRELYFMLNLAVFEEPVSEEEAEDPDEVGDYFDYLKTENMAKLLREGKSIYR